MWNAFVRCRTWFAIGTLLLGARWIDVTPSAAQETKPAAAPKKIVLIAGKKSHGPEGNGIHDYPWSVKLLKVMLDNSNVRDQVRVEFHRDGFPQDPRTLDDAAAIMVISDGRDGDLYDEAPHFQSKENIAAVQRQIDRGCGFLTFHFSTFAPDRYAAEILEWSGGYFDWETDGKRQWYSAITTLDTAVELPTPDHPVARGVRPFKMKEEFYYNLRFHPGDTALKPLLAVPALQGREPDGRVVAWARERRDGGRGFGTTCGHFYDNWRNADFRRMILNAICWTAHVDVPASGVQARFYEHDEITTALAQLTPQGRAVAEPPLRVLLFAGNIAHEWHNWRRTTPAIIAALERDARVQVDVSLDIEELATRRLGDYQVILQNYVNWQDPKTLSEASRKAFIDYLRNGGGLVLVHFANGAWNFSLPMAGDSDWPEYRKIVRRVWNHNGTGEAKSGHDAFGKFQVRATELKHGITADLAPFEINDELYFRQDGMEPIEPLITAHSKVTNRDEPLAWTYSYGKGRVYQTLLGHSEQTYDVFGPREMLRRAVAWCANRPLRPLTPEQDQVVANGAPAAAPAAKPATPSANAKPTTPAAPPQLKFVEGRFGPALDASAGALLVPGKDEYRAPPITVECWARLGQRANYNILVAQELKSSATHWELFSMAGSGVLTAYLPGSQPDHVGSNVNVADDKWHYLAMVYESDRVRLYVDGQQVADQRIAFQKGKTVAGGLGIGQLFGKEIGCQGLIDEVRLSRGAREIKAVPPGPFAVDEMTIGLWRMDAADNGQVRDESRFQNAAKLGDVRVSGPQPKMILGQPEDHWGMAAVGFNWTEQDSVDNRWTQTDVGSFLASTIPLPGQPPIAKALSIRVGDAQNATICYDTENLVCRAAWLDGFLQFHPARFGLINSPAPGGKLAWSTQASAGWSGGAVRYRGLSSHGPHVALHYDVGATAVTESPWCDMANGQRILTRDVQIAAHEQPLRWNVGRVVGAKSAPQREGADVVVVEREGELLMLAARSSGDEPLRGASWEIAADGQLSLVLEPQTTERQFALQYATVKPDQRAAVAKMLRDRKPADVTRWTKPGPARWTKPIVTQGRRAADGDSPYVVDTLTLPYENPYKALMFVAGHDFYPNGDIALCTAHGDVWRVSGVNDSLAELKWQRIATGLFQPLGLKIAREVDNTGRPVGEGVVHVLGRDQITRLRDQNGDGETDYYECFCNGYETSPGGHDYVTCLETDSQGNFYFAHAKQGIVRVDPRGTLLGTFATGLRNPNGLGMGPSDVVTAAPQEGEWTPGSAIFEVRAGNHFGYPGPKVTPQRPLGYDPPLCWIPRIHDNSSGGQVWVTSDRWGPLQGQMLHLSYGKCTMMLVPRDVTAGVPQGGTLDFPFDFLSGVMRGRFSQHDGQLYVSGLKGWVTSAVRDGCLQRVRYTGRTVTLPIAFETYANGLLLRFSSTLERTTAEDPDSYHVSQWNYIYAATYGSADYRPSEPSREGHDEVDVRSATLLPDGCSVFLEMSAVRPVMQMAVEYSLRSAEGTPLRQTLFPTLNRVRDQRFDEKQLSRRPRTGQLSAEVEARLRPGIIHRTTVGDVTDAAISRLVALQPLPGKSPSLRTLPGAQRHQFSGYVKVDLRGDYEFAVRGLTDGELIRLRVNGARLLDATFDGATGVELLKPHQAALHRGYNRLELETTVAPNDVTPLTLWWRSTDFAWEPVPPTSLFHDGGDADLLRDAQWRLGQQLFAEHRCAQCHAAPGSNSTQTMPLAATTKFGTSAKDGQLDAPDLTDAGRRLDPLWIYHWLIEPQKWREHATMPTLFDPARPEDRQAASDIALWLSTLKKTDEPGVQSATASPPSGSPGGKQIAGEELFEDLGCIACHRGPGFEGTDDFQRVSLERITTKFRGGQLAEFLRKPNRMFGATRMPDFALNDQEVAALVDHLTSREVERLAAPDELVKASAPRGRKLFEQYRCHQCHTAEPALRTAMAQGVTAIRVTNSAAGCLADAAAPSRGSAAVPNWRFKDVERQALRAYLAEPPRGTGPYPAAELAEHTVERLRCTACHTRDGQSPALRKLMAEESSRGLVPESLPNLTWTGDKLRASWIHDQLAGTISVRARPWLKARMPAFPAYAELIATGLAEQHAKASAASGGDHGSTAIDAGLAEIGRKLTFAQGGLDCRQCHAVGKDQPTGDAGTRIAPGINFALIGKRLHADYFPRFVADPPRYDVTTKMPKLVPDGRTSKVVDVLDGDAPRQFGAIWEYIRQESSRDK